MQGVRYFTCRSKFGVFVRPEKIVLDKRKPQSSVGMRRSVSKAEGISDVGRRRNLNVTGIVFSRYCFDSGSLNY